MSRYFYDGVLSSRITRRLLSAHMTNLRTKLHQTRRKVDDHCTVHPDALCKRCRLRFFLLNHFRCDLAECVLVWRTGNAFGIDRRVYNLYAGAVSTGVGGRSRVRDALAPSLYLINHPGQLSLAIPPWVREISSWRWSRPLLRETRSSAIRRESAHLTWLYCTVQMAFQYETV